MSARFSSANWRLQCLRGAVMWDWAKLELHHSRPGLRWLQIRNQQPAAGTNLGTEPRCIATFDRLLVAQSAANAEALTADSPAPGLADPTCDGFDRRIHGLDSPGDLQAAS